MIILKAFHEKLENVKSYQSNLPLGECSHRLESKLLNYHSTFLNLKKYSRVRGFNFSTWPYDTNSIRGIWMAVDPPCALVFLEGVNYFMRLTNASLCFLLYHCHIFESLMKVCVGFQLWSWTFLTYKVKFYLFPSMVVGAVWFYELSSYYSFRSLY